MIKRIGNSHIKMTIISLFRNIDYENNVYFENMSHCCKDAMISYECLNKKFDTFVTLETESNVIKSFINEFKKYLKYDNFINDIFCKQSFAYEDLDILIDKNELCKDFENINEIQSEISFLLYDQAKKHKYFNAKEFPKRFIKYLIFNKNTEFDKSYSELLTDKNILIFDNIRQSNQTVTDDVLAINSNYLPNSITVIRLF